MRLVTGTAPPHHHTAAKSPNHPSTHTPTPLIHSRTGPQPLHTPTRGYGCIRQPMRLRDTAWHPHTRWYTHTMTGGKSSPPPRRIPRRSSCTPGRTYSCLRVPRAAARFTSGLRHTGGARHCPHIPRATGRFTRMVCLTVTDEVRGIEVIIDEEVRVSIAGDFREGIALACPRHECRGVGERSPRLRRAPGRSA